MSIKLKNLLPEAFSGTSAKFSGIQIVPASNPVELQFLDDEITNVRNILDDMEFELRKEKIKGFEIKGLVKSLKRTISEIENLSDKLK